MEIKLPAMSPTMEEGSVSSWLVKPGDQVEAGQVIAEIETDKAVMELEADEDGKVISLEVEAGQDGIKVGTVIAILQLEGEEIAKPAGKQKAESAPAKIEKQSAPAAQPAEPALAPEKVAPAPSMMSTSSSAAVSTRKQTVREALRDAMAEEMRDDENVFVIGEEVAQYQGAYKVTQGLLEEFGDRRVVDTPITEHGFTGLAVGAAMAGLKPIVEFMTFNFAMQAIDQIINSAAKTNYMSGGQMRCSMVFRGPNGAASRVGAQHSQNYASWYAHVPGLLVVSPYDAADAKGLLKSAIRSPDPVVFLENELLYGHSFEVPEGDHLVPIGKARLYREGRDVTLVSYSIGVRVALEAAEQLAAEGIECEVLDLRTLRPLDEAAILESLAKTNRMVVVEEGWPTCSIASEVIAIAMEKGFDDLDAPVLRVTDKDVPLPYAANLEAAALVNSAEVVAAVRSITQQGA